MYLQSAASILHARNRQAEVRGIYLVTSTSMATFSPAQRLSSATISARYPTPTPSSRSPLAVFNRSIDQAIYSVQRSRGGSEGCITIRKQGTDV